MSKTICGGCGETLGTSGEWAHAECHEVKRQRDVAAWCDRNNARAARERRWNTLRDLLGAAGYILLRGLAVTVLMMLAFWAFSFATRSSDGPPPFPPYTAVQNGASVLDVSSVISGGVSSVYSFPAPASGLTISSNGSDLHNNTIVFPGCKPYEVVWRPGDQARVITVYDGAGRVLYQTTIPANADSVMDDTAFPPGSSYARMTAVAPVWSGS